MENYVFVHERKLFECLAGLRGITGTRRADWGLPGAKSDTVRVQQGGAVSVACRPRRRPSSYPTEASSPAGGKGPAIAPRPLPVTAAQDVEDNRREARSDRLEAGRRPYLFTPSNRRAPVLVSHVPGAPLSDSDGGKIAVSSLRRTSSVDPFIRRGPGRTDGSHVR
jgi:hypothetical protein